MTSRAPRLLELDLKPIVCVTGGRMYEDLATIAEVLSRVAMMFGTFEALIHGAARGTDTIAAKWAAHWAIPVRPFPVSDAEWKRDSGAGHKRNLTMLNQRPDIVVAFPGGGGTKNMERETKRAGYRLEPSAVSERNRLYARVFLSPEFRERWLMEVDS